MMSHHGLEVTHLSEISPSYRGKDGRKLLGGNEFYTDHDKKIVWEESSQTFKSKCIGLKLCVHDDPQNIHPLEVILDVLCHELAHCFPIRTEDYHGYDFQLMWQQLVAEVENDLNQHVRIRALKMSRIRGAGC
jgi:hypothetical protein